MEGLELHRGSLARILRRQPEGQPQDKITPVDRPILQVLDAKVVSKGGHDERLRVVLNDGDFKSEAAMFAHQARRQYGAAPPLSVVRIVDYFTSFVQMEHHHDQKRLLMICLNVEVMSMSVPALIGSPCDLPHVMERAPTAAPEGPTGGAALGQPGSYGGPPPVAAMGQGLAVQGSSGASYAQPSSIGGHQPARVAHGGEHGQQQPDRKPAHWLPGQQGGGMQGGAWGQASGGHPQYGQPASSYGGQAQQPYGGANPSHGGTPASSWDHGVTGGHPAAGGQYRPPASYSNNQAPIARNEAPARFQPVRSLNMYQNGWAIKARVTSKSELRRWSNQRGEGTILSFDVTDDQGGEIRCTAFNELAQKFNHEVHEGRVYSIRGGGIKRKRAQFNHLNSEFEISLDRNSKVEEVMEDAQTAAIPMVHFQFVPIEQLAMAEVGSVVDVLGVVDRVEPAASIQRRDQTSTEKRPLVVKDQSGVSIELTLWGNYAHSPGDDIEAQTCQGQHPILAIKGARVGDFNGKSLSTIGSSKILVEPVIAEADALRDWYLQQGGATQAARSLSSAGGSGRADRQCSLATIRNEGLGAQGAPDYVSVFAAVSTIKRSPLMYPSCPLQRAGRLCKKKMQPQDGGAAYFCEACGASAEPQWTYCASVTIMDHTGSESGVMCFQEAGEVICGVPAESLHQMEFEANETGSDDAIIAHIVKCQNRSYNLKLKVAEERWQDTPRIRLQVSRADTVMWAQESQSLLRAIQSLERGEAIMQPKQMPNRGQQPGAGGYGQVSSYGGGSQGGGAGGYGAGRGARPAPSSRGGFQGGGGGYGAAAPTRYGPPPDYNPGAGGSGWGGGGSAWGHGGPENMHANGGAAFPYHGQGPAVGKSYGPAM